jgi:hypothetical protein
VSKEGLEALMQGIDKALATVPKEGMSGEFPCPVCKTGTIKWVRVWRNKHLRMGCTTPECIMMMQ